MIGFGLGLGQGRHAPYVTRGKKKLTVVNILKKIKQKKNVPIAIIVAVYFLGDYLDDQIIGSNPVDTITFLTSLHIPILPFIIFSKAQLYGLTRWIHPKKKANGEVDEGQTVKLLKRKHRARALTTK